MINEIGAQSRVFRRSVEKKWLFRKKVWQTCLTVLNTYCGRNTILSDIAEKLWGNIQWFEKFVEVNSCTFLYGKVYNFGRPRTKRAKKNGKDYSSNGQKVQFQKTFSIEYFRKLTDLWNCKLPSVFHWKLVFADTKKTQLWYTIDLEVIRADKSSDFGWNGEFHNANRTPEGVIRRQTVELYCLFFRVFLSPMTFWRFSRVKSTRKYSFNTDAQLNVSEKIQLSC